MTPEERKAYEALVDNETDVILSIVASALGGFLNEHESICLAKILETNAFLLRGGHEPVGRYTTDMAAAVVAQLCAEYPAAFLERHGAKHFLEVPFEIRRDYWASKLQKIVEADEPLTYADQNTLRRLTQRIAAEPRLLALKYLELHPDEER